MADHNAHTYFSVCGSWSSSRRPPYPRFRRYAGLSPGPVWAGPVDFFPSDQTHFSDRLHKNWRTESLPGLSKAPSKGERHRPQLCRRLRPAPAAGRHCAPPDLPVDGGGVLPLPPGDRPGPPPAGGEAPGQFPQGPHRGERSHRPGCSRDAGPLGGTGLPQRSVADGHLEQCVLWPWPAHVRRRSGQRKSAGQRTPGPDGGADRPGGPGIGKNPGSDSQPGRQPQARAAPVPHRAAPGRTTAPGRPSPYACGGVSPTHLPTTDPACRRFPGCRVFFCPGGQDMGLSGRTNRGQRV